MLLRLSSLFGTGTRQQCSRRFPSAVRPLPTSLLRRLPSLAAIMPCLIWTAIVVGQVPTAQPQQGVPVQSGQGQQSQGQPNSATDPIAKKLQDPRAPGSGSADPNPQLEQDARYQKLFGEVTQLKDLPSDRLLHAQSPAADAVFSDEATGRKTADVGDLLMRSKSAHGVNVQKRTPIISDTRVRGQRVGQVLASGSYWAPARMDLDTMMSKIDSRLIDNAILIKGPYAVRYGPGFRFVDLQLLHSPRNTDGMHGMTSVNYNHNGEQLYGRQALWGGGEDYGLYMSYGYKTGNDYETGSGRPIPASYQAGDLFLAAGYDLSPTESIEFNYLRLDQDDTELAGLVFDLNFLDTDGYEVVYTNTAPGFADRFTSEVWYNRTVFEGDTRKPGKATQIPTLGSDLESPSGFDGFGITDGDALSGGYRMEANYIRFNAWGGEKQISVGTDLIWLNQELNDIEPLAPAASNNFPVPRSYSIDVGLYVQQIEQWAPRFSVTSGARVDVMVADAEDLVPGVPLPISDLKESQLQRDYLMGAMHLTGSYELQPDWNLDLGVGASQRPPTLTELYADNSFIGSLQRGLTFLEGDPQLKTEKMLQLDLGTRYDGEILNLGLFGYQSWVHDFITYDLITPAGAIEGFPQGAAFVNTDLATLTGFEAYGQYQFTPMLSFFGNVSFLEGRDLSRNSPARQYTGSFRSAVDLAKEPLPGIAPLESRLGILIQDPSPERRWGLEFLARIVEEQDQVATSLEEINTPGFTTYDIRGYLRVNRWLLTSGVQNLTDEFYREHVDYRTGLGVFRPGISYYTGIQVEY